MAGVTHRTSTNATHRLITSGYLRRSAQATKTHAAQYTLLGDGHTNPLPHSTNVGEWVSLSSHDVFRYKGFGKTALQIWWHLQKSGPLTASELAQRTGRHIRTVRRNLDKMSMVTDSLNGTVVPLVARDGSRWHVVEGVNLEFVAQVIGTSGVGERQRRRHQQERLARSRLRS
jgi:hypothetical protein